MTVLAPALPFSALDHPYQGTESIPATAYQLVLSGLMLDAGTSC